MSVQGGSDQVHGICVGTTRIQRAYLGGNQIFPNDPLHPDTRNFVRRVETAGGSIIASVQSAVDQFVKGFREDGLWDSTLYLNLLCTDSLTGLNVPLYAPSGIGNATIVGYIAGDYSRASGLTNANGRRLETGVTPSSAYVDANNSHFGVFSLTNVNTDTGHGAEDGSNGFILKPRNAGNANYFSQSSSGILSSANGTSAGFVIGNRLGTSVSIYRDATLLGSSTIATGSRCTRPVWIGSINNNGSAANPDTRRIAGFQFGGNGYTAAQLLRIQYHWNLFVKAIRRV